MKVRLNVTTPDGRVNLESHEIEVGGNFAVGTLFYPLGKWKYYAKQGLTVETPLGLAPCRSEDEAAASGRAEEARYQDLMFTRVVPAANYNIAKLHCIDDRPAAPVEPPKKQRRRRRT